MLTSQPFISSLQLKAALSQGSEIALLDVREHGQYGEGHPFFAVNCPFSQLEFQALVLVPSVRSRIVVLDQSGEGVAERAALHLLRLGYEDVSILDGGADGWAAAGLELFKGVNVPSKAFGEIVEHKMATPSVSAEELHRMIAAGEDTLILDGRTPDEFARMNIPTARSCPNGELAYRIGAIATDSNTRIVINCAGRTRSIIGAQTLINMGVKNPVMALRTGTQGWQLSGLNLQYGSDPGPVVPPPSMASVRAFAARFAEANAIPRIDMATLDAWRAQDGHSLYIFDVRTEAEFLIGHLPGARHAPGGQLVQATDQWIATRNARVVLTCNRGPRSVTTCYWMRAMGHDAYVLDTDVSALPLPALGNEAQLQPAWLDDLPHLTAGSFVQMRTDGIVLFDASAGTDYRAGHIVGAQWVIRPRLDVKEINPGQTVIVCGNPQRATLLADDLRIAGCRDVRVLDGTRHDWSAAGLAIEETPDLPSDEDLIDFLFFVHDRHSGSLEAARQYLAWETGLTNMMDEQEHAVFNARPPVSTTAE